MNERNPFINRPDTSPAPPHPERSGRVASPSAKGLPTHPSGMQEPRQAFRRSHRQATPMHTLCLETDMDEETRRLALRLSDRLRRLGNEAADILEGRHAALRRNPEYRGLTGLPGTEASRTDTAGACVRRPQAAAPNARVLFRPSASRTAPVPGEGSRSASSRGAPQGKEARNGFRERSQEAADFPTGPSTGAPNILEDAGPGLSQASRDGRGPLRACETEPARGLSGPGRTPSQAAGSATRCPSGRTAARTPPPSSPFPPRPAAGDDDAAHRRIARLEEAYGLSWPACQRLCVRLQARYGLPRFFCEPRIRAVWKAMEKVLRRRGGRIGRRSRRSLPPLEVQRFNRGILFRRLGVPEADGRREALFFCLADREDDWLGRPFSVRLGRRDAFAHAELARIAPCIGLCRARPDMRTAPAVVEASPDTGGQERARPLRASLVFKTIRGRSRIFLHIHIAGTPLPRTAPDGTPRHAPGTGRVGVDLGTQSIAFFNGEILHLANLAERNGVPTRWKASRRERRLRRRCARLSKRLGARAGTAGKGAAGRELAARHALCCERLRDLLRKNGATRRYAHGEMANTIRSCADILVIEGNDFVRGPTARQTGFSYASSLHYCDPRGMQTALERRFRESGGQVLRVHSSFHGSSYDHETGRVRRKTLGERTTVLPRSGTTVQRDMYSAFLLYNANEDLTSPDREACTRSFPVFLRLQEPVLRALEEGRLTVFNSGFGPSMKTGRQPGRIPSPARL